MAVYYSTGTHRFYANGAPVGSVGGAAADFDYNYTPVSDQYPATTPSSYTVNTGDTLQSIALSLYGDANLGYLIADANGLTSANLAGYVGKSITIPNRVTNIHNSYETYKPYSPGEIIGDTAPTIDVPAPPVPKGGGCSGAMILIAIIAVVATIVTAGAAAMALNVAAQGATVWGAGMSALGMTAGVSGSFAAAAIGGAVGSIAGQLTGMALGVQDKFSWGQVAAGALGSGLGAVMKPVEVASKLGVTGELASKAVNLAANAAIRNTVSQGVGIVTGQQDHFVWSNVAAAAFAAPITAPVVGALGKAVSGLGDVATRFTTNLVGGLINQGSQILMSGGGKMQIASIAADAFGNALGNSIVEQIQLNAYRTEVSAGISNNLKLTAMRYATGATVLQTIAESGDIDPTRLASVIRLTEGNDPLLGELFAGLAQRDLAFEVNRLAQNYADRAANSLLLMGAVMHAGGLSDDAALAGNAQVLGLSGNAVDAIISGDTRNLSFAERQSLLTAFGDSGIRAAGSNAFVATRSMKGMAADALADVAPIIAAVHPAAGLAVTGLAVAMEAIDQFPELKEKLGRLTALVDKDALGAALGRADLDALRLMPGIDDKAVRGALGEAMEAGFGIVNKLEGKLVDMFERSRNSVLRGAGALLKVSLDKAKETGWIGEHMAMFMLEESGLYAEGTVRPIQNPSNHGIDFIGRANTGKHAGDWVGFEVKTSTSNNFSLSDRQGHGPNWFVQDILGKAANERSRWKGDAERTAFAKMVLDEMTGKKFPGYVIQSGYINSPKPQVNIFYWK